jgi:hypothetical protein
VSEAFIEVKEGRYFIGIWLLGGAGFRQDCIGTIYRDQGETTWQLRYRFRYYKTRRRVFDHQDEKSHYRGTIEGTEDHAFDALDTAMKEIARDTGMRLDYVDVRSDEVRTLVNKMKTRPAWFHIREEK